MDYMFNDITALYSVKLIPKTDSYKSKVADTSYMFANSRSLRSIDFSSNFNTQSVKTIPYNIK